MKEKDLIHAINATREYLNSNTRHQCFAATAERDALNYLIGFLRDDHPEVSRALDKLVSTCSELRAAAKKDGAA